MSWLKAKRAKMITELVSDSDNRLVTARMQIGDLIAEAATSGFTSVRYTFANAMTPLDIKILTRELKRDGYKVTSVDGLGAMTITW